MRLKSRLEKWKDGSWQLNPSNGSAYSSEIVYATGDEDISADAAADGCRLILFYDASKEKAAILHTMHNDGREYATMLNAIRRKRFNPATTQVFLCGDQEEEDHESWNDEIQREIDRREYKVTRIVPGKGKNIRLNPGLGDLQITDDMGNKLNVSV